MPRWDVQVLRPHKGQRLQGPNDRSSFADVLSRHSGQLERGHALPGCPGVLPVQRPEAAAGVFREASGHKLPGMQNQDRKCVQQPCFCQRPSASDCGCTLPSERQDSSGTDANMISGIVTSGCLQLPTSMRRARASSRSRSVSLTANTLLYSFVIRYFSRPCAQHGTIGCRHKEHARLGHRVWLCKELLPPSRCKHFAAKKIELWRRLLMHTQRIAALSSADSGSSIFTLQLRAPRWPAVGARRARWPTPGAP